MLPAVQLHHFVKFSVNGTEVYNQLPPPQQLSQYFARRPKKLLKKKKDRFFFSYLNMYLNTTIFCKTSHSKYVSVNVFTSCRN